MRAPIGMIKQVFAAALILCVAGVLWQQQDVILSGLGFESQAETARKGRSSQGVPIIVAPVSAAKDDLLFEVVGTGRAKRSVILRLEAEGKVVSSKLVSGNRFAAGDVLLTLEGKDQQLALTLAETKLAESQRVLGRYQRLRTTGAAAGAKLDEVKTASVVFALDVERARVALADRVLRAPFAGFSGLPSVEVGDWVDSNVAIATLDDRSLLLVEFDLPEQFLGRIREGLPVTAATPAFGGREFRGEVTAIDTRVDAASRTARVRISLPNDEDLLRPGASFAIKLQLPGREYPEVPELAVQFSKGALHVWRVKGETAEKVEVRLVRRRNSTVLIDGPLSSGDLVVIEGTQRLAPGRKVNVLSGAAGAGS